MVISGEIRIDGAFVARLPEGYKLLAGVHKRPEIEAGDLFWNYQTRKWELAKAETREIADFVCRPKKRKG